MITRQLTTLAFGSFTALLLIIGSQSAVSQEPNMADSWGKQATKLRADGAKRGELFDVGNYAMFIHWGLYSRLANQVGNFDAASLTSIRFTPVK